MHQLVNILCLGLLLTACTSENEKPVIPTPSERVVEKVVVKEVKLNETSAEEKRNIQIARRFYSEVVNKHNVAMLDSFAAHNYLEHQYDTHYDSDLKGVKKAFADYFKAFPDMKVKVNFMMAEGDLVTAQITTSGTNTGPIYGQKPTNKAFEIEGVDITRFKNGKVEEHWGYAEEGKLLTQLGLIRPLIKEGRKEQMEAARRKEKKVFGVSK